MRRSPSSGLTAVPAIHMWLLSCPPACLSIVQPTGLKIVCQMPHAWQEPENGARPRAVRQLFDIWMVHARRSSESHKHPSMILGSSRACTRVIKGLTIQQSKARARFRIPSTVRPPEIGLRQQSFSARICPHVNPRFDEDVQEGVLNFVA
ncbi:uncharacterized protein CC84DRAFT_750942 [Paraphaeosphaeria sporulosa]|uniref:Secreted protein n=1 Tax=Paraphaeosphaeria sporulosa TaxID=1460663 RepID=A0A177CH12_9PLEO|nr:uncharacterized protein CC84DRAFT_750942 [Paraphaeosphaeria sporulosa]OAG06139.1 hypothetical protein CC84DRAFT_750942 [Paraphaeosphaeria sporulosa]